MAAVANKLKIGLVLDTSLDPADGVQQYVIAIGEWLRTQGHDVHYVVGQTERNDLPNIHSLARNVTVRFNGNVTTIPLPVSRRKLRKFLAHEQFDILHVQMPHSPFMAARLITAASGGTGVIGTFHIAPYNRTVAIGNHLLGIWLRRSLQRFDEVVSVSSAAADFAKQTFGMSTEVLPNVIDYEHFHGAKPLPQYEDDKLTILFLGRLVPRKGSLLLLQAVAKLAVDPEVPAFRVLICGRGPLESTLRRFVAQHRLEAIVTMVGFVSEEEKPRYYASADISVFPSSGGESFGIVLLEAMASGQATVLAGDNPGYRSVLAPRPELLFDPHDSRELAAKIKLYLLNETLRRQAGVWGAEYTHGFDVSTVGHQLLSRYYEVLRKRQKQ
jgi:phosphatidylinositol alpha-mannosyltransferase